MVINAINDAVGLIQYNLYKVDKAAAELASASAGYQDSDEAKDIDLLRPILQLNQAELETSAAARLIRAENEILGSIIDVKA